MRDRVVLPLIGLVSSLVLLVIGVLLLGTPARSATTLDVSSLPTVNAALNATSAVLLATGFVFIRRGNIRAHATFMASAFVVSVLFLVSYVIYHAHAGSRPFTGQGWIRPVYFFLLLTHIVLAAVIVPFVLTTLYRAVRCDFVRHARIARWTLPFWLYVSVTGVAVYLLLYGNGGPRNGPPFPPTLTSGPGDPGRCSRSRLLLVHGSARERLGCPTLTSGPGDPGRCSRSRLLLVHTSTRAPNGIDTDCAPHGESPGGDRGVR